MKGYIMQQEERERIDRLTGKWELRLNCTEYSDVYLLIECFDDSNVKLTNHLGNHDFLNRRPSDCLKLLCFYNGHISNAIASDYLYGKIGNGDKSQTSQAFSDLRQEINTFCRVSENTIFLPKKQKRGYGFTDKVQLIKIEDADKHIKSTISETETIQVDPPPKSIEQIMQHLKTLSNKPQLSTDTVQNKSEYALKSMHIYPDKNFIGRTNEIQEIDETFKNGNHVLFLSGMDGIGKSEIAKKYIQTYASLYDAILWIEFDVSIIRTVSSDSTFPIQGFSRIDFPEDNEREYFERKIHLLKQFANERVLIVLDNFNVESDPDLELFCDGDYRILFTTGFQQAPGNFPEKKIRPFENPDELLELFKIDYERELTETDLHMVEEIINLLERHTLSIRLIASAMQSRRIKPAVMFGLLQDGEKKLTQYSIKASDMIYNRMKQVFNLAELKGEELTVMKNLSLIPMEGINVEIFCEWCNIPDFDIVDNLAKRNLIMYDPLKDYVHLHSLIADIMSELLVNDTECCQRLIDRLIKECSNLHIYNTSFEKKQSVWRIAERACERLPEQTPRKTELLLAKILALKDLSGYTECIPELRDLWKKSDPDNQISLYCQLCNALSHAQILSGDSKSGYQTAIAGWNRLKSINDNELPLNLGYWKKQITARLAESSRNKGDYEESLDWAEQSLELSQTYYSNTKQASIGWSYWQLGRTCLLMGDIPRGEDCFKNALKEFGEISDEWASSNCYDQLAQVMAEKGVFDNAISLSKQAYDIMIPLLGPEHVDIAQNLEWRGDIYIKMTDKKQEAADCYKQAIQIYCKRNCPKRAELVLNRFKDQQIKNYLQGIASILLDTHTHKSDLDRKTPV